MNRNREELVEYEIYDNVFNIDLFNDIVNHIIFTTPRDKNGFLNNLEEKHIWFKRKLNTNIHFKYLGELLERYKEKIGTDIKDIRAISLALAYSKNILTEQMIVGTQEIDFVSEIEKIANKDIYLKAALYLYDNKKYYNYLKELKEYKYKRTEDIIFVLSIFEDFNEGFDIFKEQLKELIGSKKTLEVFDNIGIFNWLIKNLYTTMNKNRKKDMELFRCLISIPTIFAKEDSKIYNVLSENNYSREEIAYLNYAIIQYNPVPNTVRMRKSIVKEKIALNMCKVLINSEKTYSKATYNYIKEVINNHINFEIKCYGYQRIKDALENIINIQNPKTFIELYEIMDKRIFSFDILSDKWDIVASEFGESEYRDLFDDYLLFNDFDTEKISKAIEKYNKLTNSSYLNSFNKSYYRRESVYSKLVEKDIIDLKEQYIEYINSTDNQINIEYLKSYVSKIRNKKSFLFLKYFLQEHTISETDKLGFDLRWMYSIKESYYRDNKIDIKRAFLTTEENRELFYYLNEYVFKNDPESYIKFIVIVLKDEYLTSIFSKEELRNTYLTVVKMEKDLSNDRLLKEMYLTKQELEDEKRRESEERKYQELLKLQEKEKEINQKFSDIKELTFENIYEFYNYNTWDDKGQQIKAKLIKNYLNSNIKEHMITKNEIIFFNKICNKLLDHNSIDIGLYKKYIFEYINEGRNKSCSQC